jgi:hypothetical protein
MSTAPAPVAFLWVRTAQAGNVRATGRRERELRSSGCSAQSERRRVLCGGNWLYEAGWNRSRRAKS